jgi:hypothetical protein
LEDSAWTLLDGRVPDELNLSCSAVESLGRITVCVRRSINSAFDDAAKKRMSDDGISFSGTLASAEELSLPPALLEFGEFYGTKRNIFDVISISTDET